jgi:hypothetical protein
VYVELLLLLSDEEEDAAVAAKRKAAMEEAERIRQEQVERLNAVKVV